VGTLFLVATPIGHLEDITLRALHILGQVRRIASEDTRHTGLLLKHYGITTPQVSFHEHNKNRRLAELVRLLEDGDVALVSDAGTPGLSDPGYELVRAAVAAGHRVTPIPGASAPIAALVASGLPSDAFLYLGYLPRQSGERKRLIGDLAEERRTLVCFEVPHRLNASLSDLVRGLGADRPAVVCRELTKVHEDFRRGTLGALADHFASEPPRGEITLVIGGAPADRRWSLRRVRAALKQRTDGGESLAQASRSVAQVSGWPRQEVYRLALAKGRRGKEGA
jgi:16S rRNA (cytidine1402-2'-O)-methyltransferase